MSELVRWTIERPEGMPKDVWQEVCTTLREEFGLDDVVNNVDENDEMMSFEAYRGGGYSCEDILQEILGVYLKDFLFDVEVCYLEQAPWESFKLGTKKNNK